MSVEVGTWVGPGCLVGKEVTGGLGVADRPKVEDREPAVGTSVETEAKCKVVA